MWGLLRAAAAELRGRSVTYAGQIDINKRELERDITIEDGIVGQVQRAHSTVANMRQ